MDYFYKQSLEYENCEDFVDPDWINESLFKPTVFQFFVCGMTAILYEMPLLITPMQGHPRRCPDAALSWTGVPSMAL